MRIFLTIFSPLFYEELQILEQVCLVYSKLYPPSEHYNNKIYLKGPTSRDRPSRGLEHIFHKWNRLFVIELKKNLGLRVSAFNNPPMLKPRWRANLVTQNVSVSKSKSFASLNAKAAF